mgnify:CR=1 FL=1
MEIHYRTQHWSLRPVRDMSQEEEEEVKQALRLTDTDLCFVIINLIIYVDA